MGGWYLPVQLQHFHWAFLLFQRTRENTHSHHNENCGALGSLHTQAKRRDHEIVQAQKRVSNGRSNTPPNLCSVVTDP